MCLEDWGTGVHCHQVVTKKVLFMLSHLHWKHQHVFHCWLNCEPPEARNLEVWLLKKAVIFTCESNMRTRAQRELPSRKTIRLVDLTCCSLSIRATWSWNGFKVRCHKIGRQGMGKSWLLLRWGSGKPRSGESSRHWVVVAYVSFWVSSAWH